ncbi:unnamed protein product [Soboliphyme baturini]|uniref:Uncharacterized protein n=1 Tax=Soboliphyme baturini TaxID=241478 RepID=A0A183IQ89_9BILA|nr:unnamed protein product [Soboliphyme baturini]
MRASLKQTQRMITFIVIKRHFKTLLCPFNPGRKGERLDTVVKSRVEHGPIPRYLLSCLPDHQGRRGLLIKCSKSAIRNCFTSSGNRGVVVLPKTDKKTMNISFSNGAANRSEHRRHTA